jgi:TPR repeat protein
MFESDWPRRGAYWLGLAARQGDRAAELELGICYEDGNCNVPRDQAQAIVLLKAAAEQHSALAEQRIGLDYEIGNGLPHDRPLAVSWLRRAGADGAPGATKTADVLSRTREGQLHSVGEIDALVNPPPPPRKLKPGECPSFQTYLAGPRAQAQQYLFCQAHPGCPSSSAGWNGPRCPG